MAATPTAIRNALKAAVQTIDGLTGYARVTGQINLPAVIVEPGPISYSETLRNGTHGLAYTVVVLVSDTDSDLAQQLLDEYLAHPSDKSILAAVEADTTLGGVVDWVVCRGVSSYGLIEYSGTQYVGARFPVEVSASGS